MFHPSLFGNCDTILCVTYSVLCMKDCFLIMRIFEKFGDCYWMYYLIIRYLLAILVIKHPDLAKIIEYYHQTPFFNLSGKLKRKKRPSSKSSIFDDATRGQVFWRNGIFSYAWQKRRCVCAIEKWNFSKLETLEQQLSRPCCDFIKTH